MEQWEQDMLELNNKMVEESEKEEAEKMAQEASKKKREKIAEHTFQVLLVILGAILTLLIEHSGEILSAIFGSAT